MLDAAAKPSQTRRGSVAVSGAAASTSARKAGWHERREATATAAAAASELTQASAPAPAPRTKRQRQARPRVLNDDDESADDDEGDDDDDEAPLSARAAKAPRKAEPTEPSPPQVDATPATATAVHAELAVKAPPAAAAAVAAAAVAVAGPSRAQLVAEYERLTKEVLPRLAAERRFPIRFDHCFQRVALDVAFGGCWYAHLDRKKGPAIKQIGVAPLARAVEAARRMADEGVEAVRELDAQSLRWRGKQPKRA